MPEQKYTEWLCITKDEYNVSVIFSMPEVAFVQQRKFLTWGKRIISGESGSLSCLNLGHAQPLMIITGADPGF